MNAFFPEPLLAIETSCDETSVAVLVGNQVKANTIASQIELHRAWGGVVPEAAARAHVEAFLPTLDRALGEAHLTLDSIRAIAVTNRPGLVGALSVGASAAKALAFRFGLPIVAVHHLEGHICSVLATDPELEPPFATLIVSGGHTELLHVAGWGQYRILGGTIDDAAGEAFDKAARLLGLGYPGGQAVEIAAHGGDPLRYQLPQALSERPFEFSFSGLKTAVLRLVEREGDRLNIPDAAASVQFAITEVLAKKAVDAAEAAGTGTLTVVGGVSANKRLRERLLELTARANIRLVVPPLVMCTDNAAMIGFAGSLRLAQGQGDGLDFDVISSAALGTSTDPANGASN